MALSQLWAGVEHRLKQGYQSKMKPPHKSYLICATPRSGSSLLCEALQNTGLAGNPDEYFGPMHVQRWNERWQTRSVQAYVKKAISFSQGETDVVGMKIMRLYWQNFMDDLRHAADDEELSEFELLHHWFPNLQFIFITRRDKVRQAISWLKFLQGSAWHWTDTKPQQLKDLEFKPEIIQEFIVQTTAHETAWLKFFRENNVTPFTVVYEEFVHSYEKTAKEILNFLKITYPPNLNFRKRQLKQQADALTDIWVQQYLKAFNHTEKM